MMLSAGAQLGPYEIVGPLGAGGRGEVYRAHDARLGRDVAVKVLHTAAMSGDDRLRFEIEARALSKLSHPNILAVHDVGEENGTPFIVSELLDGDSLRDLIVPGGMPLRKLLDIAVQIADGLAAAHASGLVHRDLKPENIIVQRDGRAKILDFGLVKQAVAAEDKDATRTMLITSPGAIVGTLAYLSPEQALGTDVDYRADQFALGLILYEMATGRRPFERADRVSTLAAIVKEEPAPISGAGAVPPAPLRWVIDRCLAKDAAQRYVSTADLYHELRDLRDHVSEVVAGEVAVTYPRRRRWLALSLLGGGALAAGLVLGALTFPREAAVRYRFTPFATDATNETQPAWSPDGRTLAYTAQTQGIYQVFARNVDSAVPAQITSAAANCLFPFWSPDGTRVYYQSGSSLWSVSAAGGAPREIASGIQQRSRGATMSPDGKTLALIRAKGQELALYFQPLDGGSASVYSRAPFPPAFRFATGIQFAPNGRNLLAGIMRAINVESAGEIWMIPFPEGTPRRIYADIPGGFRVLNFSWLPDNRHAAFSTELTPGAGNHLYTLDTETGAVEPITTGTGEERYPAVSPDGKRIAFVNGGVDTDVVEIPVDGTASIPLLATSRREYGGDWAPSGHQFVYVSDAAGIPEIWLRNASEGWSKPVVQGVAEGTLQFAVPRFSPDGQRIAYTRVGLKHLVWISNVSGGREVWLEQESTDQHAPAWSPDGRWIAYFRYVGQKWEVAKAPSGGGGQPVRLCDGGGPSDTLEWSPSGEWICFKDQQGLHAVAPDGGTPRRVHEQAAAFTFARDGASLYVVQRAADRHWEVVRVGVPAGVESQATALRVPRESVVSWVRLHPDGRRFIATVETSQLDVWILDDFALGQRRWARFGF